MDLQCSRCELHLRRTQVVPGEGNKNARIMFVGECPGPDEDRAGRPFVGKSGKLLRQVIQALQLGDVYITNVVKCFPKPKLNPEQRHVERCSPHLEHEIFEEVNPDIIVGVGKTSTSFLLDGNVKSIMKIAGTITETRFGPVLPVPHPSYCLRGGVGRDQYVLYFVPLILWR